MAAGQGDGRAQRPRASRALDQANQSAGIVVGVQGYSLGSLCGAVIVAHEGLCRELRLKGMLDTVNDRAPFCPLAIHVDMLCCAMALAAMYSRDGIAGVESNVTCGCGGRQRVWCLDGQRTSHARGGIGPGDDCDGSGGGVLGVSERE